MEKAYRCPFQNVLLYVGLLWTTLNGSLPFKHNSRSSQGTNKGGPRKISLGEAASAAQEVQPAPKLKS